MIWVVQSLLKKYSDFQKLFLTANPNHLHVRTRPVPHEGRLEIVTNAGQDAVDAGGAKDEGASTCGRRSRVVLTPHGWRQVREKPTLLGDDGDKQVLIAGESTKEAVKTIAWGMPGDFRCDLTTRVLTTHYHCTRGYRAHRAPGIPCALSMERAERAGQNSGETRRGIANLCLRPGGGPP